MAGVILTGMLIWRKSDIYCSIAFSAVIMLLSNSFMLYDMGFILSYAATLSLVIFYKPIFEKMPLKIPKFVRDILAGTIAAQIGVMPIIAYCFNTVSLISILTNLLTAPLTGVLTVLGALAAILGGICLPAGRVFGLLARISADIILFITRRAAAITWAEINIATPSFVLVVIYYFVILYFRYCHPKISREAARPLAAVIFAVCGGMILLISIPNQALKIYFADVGQGDCALIRQHHY
jgi:competence protein ComEC